MIGRLPRKGWWRLWRGLSQFTPWRTGSSLVEAEKVIAGSGAGGAVEATEETMDFVTNTITLTDFIRQEERKYTAASGTFTNILLSIALGAKVVSRGVNRVGLAAMMGLTGEKNVQGEDVQKLDEYADQVFSSILGRSGEFFSMVSEEQEGIVEANDGSAKSRYVIAFDPLDGSSNIDVNVSIGSIWGIYRRLSNGDKVDLNDVSDYLQPGYKQVAAGYTIYGSSTMFVFSTGTGVSGFTLDPNIGEFVLTHPKLSMPKSATSYSCNEGNYQRWSPGIRAYVDYVKSASEGDKSRPYSHRYVGSLVADFHRILLKGGVFLYPADAKNKNGKLRLLYECAPLAFLAEQAGGKASDGRQPILDIVPAAIHQRSPLIIGSAENVEHIEAFIRDLG